MICPPWSEVSQLMDIPVATHGSDYRRMTWSHGLDVFALSVSVRQVDSYSSCETSWKGATGVWLA